MENKAFDVVALGELLVDFTQNGLSEQGNLLFEANPGGAPANVLAMLRKLGKRCAFVGKVGADSFGDMLARTVEEAGIDTRGLMRDREIPTTLAVVHTFPNGDRDFSFYRKPGADILTDDPCRAATEKAVKLAKEAGALISFDPNLRLPLWKTEDDAKAAIEWGLARCDVLKIADNELLFMTGESDFDRGASILRGRFPNIRLFDVTAGAEGSYAYYGEERVFVPACKRGGVIETTGAGDTFCASVLSFVLEHGIDGLTDDDLRAMLRFANTAAYIVTTKKGAIRSMPEREQVNELLARI